MKSNTSVESGECQSWGGWEDDGQAESEDVIGFDVTRVEQTSVCSLCDAYEANLCRQNGHFFLHTRKSIGASLAEARHVDSTCKPITEEAGRLMIKLFGSSKDVNARKVADLDRKDGVGRKAKGRGGK
jgi:hypothetical protein